MNNNLNLKRDSESQELYVLKAFAIFSVICAHCSSVGADGIIWNLFVSNILKSVGAVGIFVFYFLSGYFLYFTQKKIGAFWKNKFFSIIIPWLFGGSTVYLYIYLRKGNISIITWLKWIAGMDTYLYYVVLLLIFFALFYPLRKNKIFPIVFATLSVIENILLFVIPKEIFSVKYPYLDPLRFGYMFSLGLIVANFGLLPKIMSFSRKSMIYLSVIIPILLIVPGWFGFYYQYFTLWYIPYAILFSFLLIGFSQYIKGKKLNLFLNIGRWSYTIYLIHMPFAGIVVKISDLIDNPFVTILRPFIILTVVYFLIMFIIAISHHIKLNKLLNVLFGLR